MQKDFDAWNIRKKQTDERLAVFGVREREIWWVSFGLNIGVEIDGKNHDYERPALVIKKFNSHMAWVVPLTSQQKSPRFYSEITVLGKKYFVSLTQLRTISTKRLLRRETRLSQDQFVATVERIIEFFPRKKTLAGL